MTLRNDNSLLIIGKIIGSHGLKGEARVVSYAESADFFTPGTTLFLKRSDGREAKYVTASARPHKKGILLKLRGIDSVDEINAWRTAEVLYEKGKLEEPDDGTYYWFQIIGLNVITVDHRPLGKVESIIRTGSNDVYVVRDKSQKEVLVPALDSVIREIDLKKGLMLVDLPDGLTG